MQPNVTEDGWRILDFLDVFLRQHVRNHNIEKSATVLAGMQLDKLYMIGEFLVDNFGLLMKVMMRLYETVSKLLVRTGLNEFELAVKLVHLNA